MGDQNKIKDQVEQKQQEAETTVRSPAGGGISMTSSGTGNSLTYTFMDPFKGYSSGSSTKYVVTSKGPVITSSASTATMVGSAGALVSSESNSVHVTSGGIQIGLPIPASIFKNLDLLLNLANM